MTENFMFKVVATTFPSILAVVGGFVLVYKDDFLGFFIIVFAVILYLLTIIKEYF